MLYICLVVHNPGIKVSSISSDFLFNLAEKKSNYCSTLMLYHSDKKPAGEQE